MLAAMLVLATSTTADAGPSQTAKPPAADSPPLRSGGESAAGGFAVWDGPASAVVLVARTSMAASMAAIRAPEAKIPRYPLNGLLPEPSLAGGIAAGLF